MGGARVAADDDKYDDVYVREIAFPGGPYLLIQGGTSDAANTFEAFRDVTFSAAADLPDAFVREVEQLARVCLVLADHVASRAGLRRHDPPGLATQSTPDVPGASRLRELEACVQVSLDELSALLPSRCQATVRGLSVLPGDLDWTFDEGPPDALTIHPLLRSPEGIVVSAPTELASTFRYHFLRLAGEHDCLEQIASSLAVRSSERLEEALELMGYRPVGSDPEWSPCLLERRFSGTGHPDVHVTLIVDDLVSSRSCDLFGNWTRAQELADRALDILDPPGTASREASGSTLRLLVTAGVGNYSFVGLRNRASDGPFLMLQLSDLCTLGDLMAGDPSALWYFAKADNALHARSQVRSFSKLDNYSVYVGHEKSYYLTDDAHPSFVPIEPGEGRIARMDAARRLDRHRRADPDNFLAPLISLHGSEVAPLYIVDPAYRRDVHVAELGAASAWVSPAATTTPEVAPFVCDLVEATAYWCWQLGCALPEWVEEWGSDRLVCYVSVDDTDGWSRLLRGEPIPPTTDGSTMITATFDEGVLRLEAQLSGALRMRGQGNEADHDLVAALLSLTPLDPALVSEILDVVVPQGQKRMLHVIDPTEVLMVPGILTRSRPLRPEASALALDAAAEWLATSRWPIGPVAESQRNTILNDVVAYYFRRIVECVSEFDGQDLLRYLIAQDEAHLHAQARQAHMLPARVAAFGEGNNLVQELVDDMRRETSTAVASRFLIEYVAATPPRGSRRMSALDYDWLLVLAAEIVSRGHHSDAIHFDFSDAEVSVLGCGRLGVSREGDFNVGNDIYARARAERSRQQALSPSEDNAPSATFSLDSVNAAMTEEFGFTHDELGQILMAILDLCGNYDEPEPTSASVSAGSM